MNGNRRPGECSFKGQEALESALENSVESGGILEKRKTKPEKPKIIKSICC